MRGMIGLGPLCGVLLCTLVACGGDDDGSGVDSDKTLDEVTIGEAMDLCEAEFDSISADDIFTVACFLFAIGESEGDPEADCDALAQECLDLPEDQRPDTEAECEIDPESFGDLPACASEITVGELEDCIFGISDAFADLADEVSCDLSSDEVIDALDFAGVSACASIQERCPELFE